MNNEDEVISPIISAGDIIGAVVLLNKDKKKHFGEVRTKSCRQRSGFFGKTNGITARTAW